MYKIFRISDIMPFKIFYSYDAVFYVDLLISGQKFCILLKSIWIEVFKLGLNLSIGSGI